MIKEKMINTPIQTFFVSRELSNCPYIPDIIRLGKKFVKLGMKDIENYCISITYGKRILVNTKHSNIEKINQQDFIEIVDYDPLKNIILAMGKKYPCIDTPIHWLIHHARDDVNVIIQFSGEGIVRKFLSNFSVTKEYHPPGTLELAKEVLKTLRSSKKIIIKNIGVLFVGISIKEVEDMIVKAYEESI